MYKLGDIILIPFPFTDLSSTKVRPALIISKNNQKSQNVIVCFITSNQRQTKNDVKIEKTPETGLKIPMVQSGLGNRPC
ncbi:MAG: type II toxin-antitoxin system PemK/MazF family toxin [Desulfamplus sp.]